MATTDQRNRRKGSRGPTARDTAVSRSGLFGSDPSGGDGSGGSVSDDRVSDDRVSDDTVSADSLSEAISLLESFVGAFEPGRYSGEDAAVLVERFSLGERLCATGKALAAKRVAETELHRRDGSRSAAEWLAGKTGESLGHAAGSLQLANQMEDHPGLGDALRSGELSQTRAHTVAGVLKLDPNSEDELLKAAKDRTETNRQLADRCLRAKARARSAEDNRAAHERLRAARFLRHYTDGDGAFRLEGSFTPDAGARLLAALKPTRTVLFDEARRQGLREHPDAYGADALVALLTGERQRRPRAPRGDEATTGQRAGGRADTDRGSLHGDEGTDSADSGNPADFADSAHTDSGDEADGDQDTTGWSSTAFPPPASVHLRVDLAALRRGHLKDAECCEIPGVGPVPIETARELLGDAIVELVITKGRDIASVTHLGRTVRAPLRRALIERDQTCVIPGCDVREGLQIDHRIIPVVENGETALWNLARLCRHHHYLRHHAGFRLEGGPGDWQWLPPEKPPPQNLDQPGDGKEDRLFKLE